MDVGGSQLELYADHRNGRGTAREMDENVDRRRSRESLEAIDVDQSPNGFNRDAEARHTSSKSHEHSVRPDSSELERPRTRQSKSRSPSV